MNCKWPLFDHYTSSRTLWHQSLDCQVIQIKGGIPIPQWCNTQLTILRSKVWTLPLTPAKREMAERPWNTVDLLNKVACYVKYVNNVFNIKRSWFKRVGTRRSTVLSLLPPVKLPWKGLPQYHPWKEKAPDKEMVTQQ